MKVSSEQIKTEGKEKKQTMENWKKYKKINIEEKQRNKQNVE